MTPTVHEVDADPARVEALLPRARRAIEANGEPYRDPHEMAGWWARLEAAQWQRVIPPRFRHAHVDQLDEPFASAVSEWRQNPGRSLVLLGSVGCGKTHAACAALRLAIEAGRDVAFWPVTELLDALRPDGAGADMERLTGAGHRTISQLVVDDLGTERLTDWGHERLYTLVNKRWLNGLSIIATSNLSVNGGKGPLVDAVGERLYSRLVDGAVVVQAAGEDRRRQR